MAKGLFLLLVLFIPYFTVAQVVPSHGTIIVMEFSDDELAIAADSKGTRGGPIISTILTEPDYSQCKILTFDNQIVFTMVNGTGFRAAKIDPVGTWDVRDILRQVISAEPKTSDVGMRLHNIAMKWGNAVADKFRAEYQWHRTDVVSMAEEGKGILTAGFLFAKNASGALEIWNPFIALNQSLSDPIIIGLNSYLGGCWACAQRDKVCAAGQPSVVEEFCTGHVQQSRIADGYLSYPNRLLDIGWDLHTIAANRLADLVEAYDISGTVGGPIDVLKLEKSGSIRWLAKKDNCKYSEN